MVYQTGNNWEYLLILLLTSINVLILPIELPNYGKSREDISDVFLYRILFKFVETFIYDSKDVLVPSFAGCTLGGQYLLLVWSLIEPLLENLQSNFFGFCSKKFHPLVSQGWLYAKVNYFLRYIISLVVSIIYQQPPLFFNYNYSNTFIV